MTKNQIDQMELKTNKTAISENHIYGKLGKRLGYAPFEDFKVNGNSLSLLFAELEDEKLINQEKLVALKNVIINQQKDIDTMKLILQKYGLE